MSRRSRQGSSIANRRCNRSYKSRRSSSKFSLKKSSRRSGRSGHLMKKRYTVRGYGGVHKNKREVFLLSQRDPQFRIQNQTQTSQPVTHGKYRSRDIFVNLTDSEKIEVLQARFPNVPYNTVSNVLKHYPNMNDAIVQLNSTIDTPKTRSKLSLDTSIQNNIDEILRLIPAIQQLDDTPYEIKEPLTELQNLLLDNYDSFQLLNLEDITHTLKTITPSDDNISEQLSQLIDLLNKLNRGVIYSYLMI